MNNNLLVDVLAEYIGGKLVLSTDKYDVIVKIDMQSSTFFTKKIKYKTNILVQFNTNEINYLEIVTIIYDYLTTINPTKIKSIISNWFVVSDQGGIYLYEEIAKKEHKVYKTMNNNFIVINSNNGITSFGPGHIKNSIISEELKEVLENYRIISLQEWKNKIFGIFGICQEIIEKKI